MRLMFSKLQAQLDRIPAPVPQPQSFELICSGETEALTTGYDKAKIRLPYAFTISAVKASLSTPQSSGSILTVDVIRSSGSVSLFSTPITIDNNETYSATAATPAVLSITSMFEDQELSVAITQVGDGTAKGLKVYIIGYAA